MTPKPNDGFTHTLASSHLARWRLGQSLVDLYATSGGTFLGLALLKRSNISEIVVPSDLRLSAGDFEGSLGLFDSALPDSLSSGFAIKYSGHRESFSPACARGVFSSRYRFWDGVDGDRAYALINNAWASRPETTRCILLQQYMKGPDLSGVFYAYGYQNRTLIEMTSMGRRTVTEMREGRPVRSATVAAPHIKSASVYEANPLVVHRLVSRLRAHLGFDLDIEGFQRDEQIIAVQLRPIPDDMPHEPDHVEVSPGAQSRWHETPLTWGTWKRGRYFVNRDVPGVPAVIIKDAISLKEAPVIQRRLERGDATMVVDIVDGFRLSHDPSYLPEDVAHRQVFAYISVAGSPLANLQTGDAVEVATNGDVGRIRRVDVNDER